MYDGDGQHSHYETLSRKASLNREGKGGHRAYMHACTSPSVMGRRRRCWPCTCGTWARRGSLHRRTSQARHKKSTATLNLIANSAGVLGGSPESTQRSPRSCTSLYRHRHRRSHSGCAPRSCRRCGWPLWSATTDQGSAGRVPRPTTPGIGTGW
jgi:hypothetical protein